MRFENKCLFFIFVFTSLLPYIFCTWSDNYFRSGRFMLLTTLGPKPAAGAEPTWYVVLARIVGKEEWTMFGGKSKLYDSEADGESYSKWFESRKISAVRELGEESAGAFKLDDKHTITDATPHVKDTVYGIHSSKTFVVQTEPFENDAELRKIIIKFTKAPVKSGSRETDGVALVNVKDLLDAAGKAGNTLKVTAKVGFKFRYATATDIEDFQDSMIVVHSMLKDNLKDHLSDFEKAVENAKKKPVIVKHRLEEST